MPLPPRAPGSPDHDLRTSPPAVRRSLIPWSLRFVLAATVSDARGSRVLLRHGLGGTKPARRHRTTGGDFYTTRVGSERAHALLRQPRHGSRAWYCPFTLASGSDPRHESRVALLGVFVRAEPVAVERGRRRRLLAHALGRERGHDGTRCRLVVGGREDDERRPVA